MKLAKWALLTPVSILLLSNNYNCAPGKNIRKLYKDEIQQPNNFKKVFECIKKCLSIKAYKLTINKDIFDERNEKLRQLKQAFT